MTGLVVQQDLGAKYVAGVVASGYSGGDLVARQLLGAMCLNRGLILPPRALLLETAHDPGDALRAPGIARRLDEFSAGLSKIVGSTRDLVSAEKLAEPPGICATNRNGFRYFSQIPPPFSRAALEICDKLHELGKTSCNSQFFGLKYSKERRALDRMLNIVLVEPEIPANTGNIARTCAATGSVLHLIKPLGFDISDKAVKRAGLDYWHLVDVKVYESWEDFLARTGAEDFWLFSTKAPGPMPRRHLHRTVTWCSARKPAGFPRHFWPGTPSDACAFPSGQRPGA